MSQPQHVCTGPWNDYSHILAITLSLKQTVKGGDVAKVTLAGRAILYCMVRCQNRQGTSKHTVALRDLDVCGNGHCPSVCLPQLHSPDSHRLLSSCLPPEVRCSRTNLPMNQQIRHDLLMYLHTRKHIPIHHTNDHAEASGVERLRSKGESCVLTDAAVLVINYCLFQT